MTVRAADAENPVHFVRSHLQLELGRFWIWPTQLSSYPRVSIYEATTRSLLIACAVICLALAAASGRPSSVAVALGIVLLGSILVMARRATRVVGMAGLLLGLCLTPLAGFANASQLVGLAFALIASQLRIVPALVVLTTWFGCFVAAYLSSAYAADTAMLVDHGVLSLGCIVAIAICHHLLVHRIVRLDRVRSREFELELSQRLRDDEKRAGESARRVLHDQVLFTLIRIADSAGVESDWLGRDCRSSVGDVVRLAQWNAPIVLYTSEERPYLIQTAVTAGITALCLKHDGLDALVRTLASIRDGELRPSRQLAASLADLPPLRARLTPTEATVLRGLAYGLSASEIAARLCVSVDTVRCHTKHIHEKYRAVLGDGPVNRQQTLRAALEDGYWDAREWGEPWNIP